MQAPDQSIMAAMDKMNLQGDELVPDVPKELQIGDSTTDVVFLVEGRELHFSKALLTWCSPVLSRMLTPQCLQENPKGVPLPGKQYKTMAFLFQQMHPVYAVTAHLTDDILLEVLDLAREYETDHVKTKCEQYISNQLDFDISHGKLKTDRLFLFLATCGQHGLGKTQKRLVKLAAEKSCKELENCNNITVVPPAILKEVFLSRCKALEKIESRLRRDNDSLVDFIQSVERITEFRRDSVSCSINNKMWDVYDLITK